MLIDNPRIHATPVALSQTHTLRITYTLEFTNAEVNGPFEFEDSTRIREEDDTSGDDVIFNWAVPFVFNSTQASDNVTWTYDTVSNTILDTELGGEEIYGQIFLRNRTTGQVIQANTPILPLAV
jgi:long-subunit fatty acid transport protein